MQIIQFLIKKLEFIIILYNIEFLLFIV